MKAVLTIVGTDQIGIVHKVTGLLVKYNINIIDITQTIMEKYFTMIMLLDITEKNENFDEIVINFTKLGEELGIQVKIQHEDIFNSMYKL